MSTTVACVSSTSSASSALVRGVVHKFGGSSLADAACVRHVYQVLMARQEPLQVIVVSAIKGATDTLIRCAQQAANQQRDWEKPCWLLHERHRQLAQDLLQQAAEPTVTWLDRRFAQLGNMLQAIAVLGEVPVESLDRLQGMGELCSAQLLTDYFKAQGQACVLLDARDVLVVHQQAGQVEVDWELSQSRFQQFRQSLTVPRVVITGYIASTPTGRPTTLGRNGSDYSAAIFARLFAVDELQIWTDVDGLMSADPRLVPDAVQLATVSYQEACELAHLGTQVIHPQTLRPAMDRGIRIMIRNTFDPQRRGTWITAQPSSSRPSPVTGLTLSADLVVFNLEGIGLLDIAGMTARMGTALQQAGVFVVMTWQGAAKHALSCFVKASQAELGQSALRRAFQYELRSGQIQRIQLTSGVRVLAVVGDGMQGQPGVAAQLFASLKRAGVHIRAIAQGANARNISVALDSQQAQNALRAVHAGFWLSAQTFAIGLIGPGQVGGALLDQLCDAQALLRSKCHLDLRLSGILSRSKMVLETAALHHDWRQALTQTATAPADLHRFIDHLLASQCPHTILIDCSNSSDIADQYVRCLAAGVHVVTPNKQAGSGSMTRYRHIRQAVAQSGAHFFYEATVGAGLPIMTTLRDLLDTGDTITSIEGIFSGTLAWLFNQFDGRIPFSHLVAQARAVGYTEPDPRDDLSGIDVARKLVILAREAGWQINLEDVQIENLLPDELYHLSVDAFMSALPQVDERYAQRLASAKERRCVLRYVARLVAGQAPSLGLVELPIQHPFANLRLTDNIVQFMTKRYCQNPLIVQGPGAGPEVTAAGVFADVLRIAAREGARL